MKKLLFLFSLLFVLQHAMAQKDFQASISIPQNSGLAFVKYHIYEIHNNQLYVIERSIIMNLDTAKTKNPPAPFKYDTLATYPVSKEQLLKLTDIVEHTDSLGSNTADGCEFTMGWPRFFIYTSYKDKTMSGYVANCYREHIYKIVDQFNAIYPKGDVITYNQKDLAILEAKCNAKVK